MVRSDIARTLLGAIERRCGHGALLLGCCLALAGTLAGCEKGLAGALRPDFSGVWDVTYDDSLDVEVQLGADQVVRETLGEQGGQLSFSDASVSTELALDCTRPELVCPAEVWPRELVLSGAPGKLDSEGVQLAQPLAGAGQGRCAALGGSLITGELMTVAVANAIRPDAVALTSGRIRVVLDGACFGPEAALPAGTRVVLTAGYTAAKR
jgi:hypothetical protein